MSDNMTLAVRYYAPPSHVTPKYFPRRGPQASAQADFSFDAQLALLDGILKRSSRETYRLSHGTAVVIAAGDIPDSVCAATLHKHALLDHRYYGVVQRSLGDQFALHYMIIRDQAGNFAGMQPFFVVDQDILAGMNGQLSRVAEGVRRRFPNFLKMKTLMVGNAAGPTVLGMAGNAAQGADGARFACALSEAFMAYGRSHGVKILVFKDFAAETRGALKSLCDTTGADFVRIPSMPMTRLSLKGYRSFEDYMQRGLSKTMRKNLRRKFRDSDDADIQMTVATDIRHCVDEAYALYLQVYERAEMKFEKLTRDFFLELGRTMPDAARFFLWRKGGVDGKMVAMSATLVNHGGQKAASSICDLYLGMDYPLALEKHLYFVTMRDVIQWSIANGIDTYYSTPLCYDAKLHLHHELVPLDLYARHISPILNPAFKFAMRFAQPTRQDKILPQFPNVRELTGEP